MKQIILKAKVPLIVYFHRLKPAVSLTYNVTPQFNLNELCRIIFFLLMRVCTTARN